MKIIAIISIVFLVSTLICGLWVKFHPQGNDMNFHFWLSLSTVILSLITIALFMIKLSK